MSSYQGVDVWLQWFSCCINQPTRKRAQQRRRIDRSMIGEPTNFRHTGHVGSGDIEMGNSQLREIQRQMRGKGGYEPNLAVRAVRQLFKACLGCADPFTISHWTVNF